MKHRVTQAQIAQEAGVCQSTVSQVLSGRHTSVILPETCDRILRVAQEMGYRRRATSQRSRTKKGTIAFLIPERRSHEVMTIYIRRLYTGVLQQLDAQRYHLIQAVLHNDELVPEVVRQGKVDGVVIEDACDQEVVRRVQELVPVVLLNYNHDCLSVDCCIPDNVNGIWQGFEHLYRLGHRRIALFGFDPEQMHHAERLRGYYSALKAYGLPQRDEDVVLAHATREFDSSEAEELASQTLQRWFAMPDPPTAVMALCDANASELMRAAYALDIRIPEQLSVIGFDNASFCEHTQPRLTSIHQPMEEMGHYACSLLMERIAGQDRPAKKIRLGVSLVIRESTAPPAGRRAMIAEGCR